MSELLIKNGRVIDPASGLDDYMDISVEKGRVSQIGKNLAIDAAKTYNAAGRWITPGLVDIHVHLREPGFEYKETIKTGSRSAAAGGFTSVACMPNTKPVNDCATVTDFIVDKAARDAIVNVYVIGAITKGQKGESLAEIGEMKERGVVALSDDGRCVMNTAVLRKAMEYAGMFGLPLIEHAEDENLRQNGVMHEGGVSSEMGLSGNNRAAEEVIVARDIVMAEHFGAHIHIAHISTAGSVELVRQAKKRGVKVTAEAAPHHFTLTDDACRGYNTSAKMAPPLRERKDVEAICAGLADGTIDCIATDHAPHSVSEKEVEFDHAHFGIVGLETALPLSLALVREETLTPLRLVDAMSRKPAEIIKIDRGTLAVGAVADITIIDPDAEWKVDPAKFKSKGRNTPFAGWTMKGRACATIVKGKIVYELKEQTREQ